MMQINVSRGGEGYPYQFSWFSNYHQQRGGISQAGWITPIKNKVISFLNSTPTNEAESSHTNTWSCMQHGEDSPRDQAATPFLSKTEIRYPHGLIRHN